MPEGGRIKIQTRNVVLDDDHCRSFYGVKPGKYAELLVSDTGRGMDNSTLEKIFEPFFSTKDRGSIRGTGLGLSVVQGIVESHGGHIKVESQPGKGTEFRIYLPGVDQLEESKEEIDAQLDGTLGGNETILYVEDEPLGRDMVTEYLEKKGYRVITAVNGERNS